MQSNMTGIKDKQKALAGKEGKSEFPDNKEVSVISYSYFPDDGKPPLYTLTSTETLVSSEGSDVSDVEKSDVLNNKGLAWTIRRWLIIPICFLYGGAVITQWLVVQQYVYVKIQRDKFPNVTIKSVPLCNANESDPDYQIQQEAQRHAADWQSYFTMAMGIPATVTNIILGSFTDRFGRKFLFFLPIIGGCINMAIFTCGVHFNFDLHWYIPGCVLEGLTGSAYALLTATFGYTADLTDANQDRSMGIVLVNLMYGFSMTIFSITQGFFIQGVGFFWPMIFSVGAMFVVLILISLLPETLPKEKNVQSKSVGETLYSTVELFCGKENAGYRWMYNLLLMTFTVGIFTALGRMQVEALYQMNDPFCWDPKHLSWFAAISMGAQGVLGMSIVKPLQKLLTDESIALIGIISLIGGTVLEGLAWNDAALYASAIVMSLGMLTLPMVRGIMSKMTPTDKQGAIFATIACIESAASVGGVVVANAIYRNTLSFYKGFVFFVFAGSNVIGLILLAIFKFGSRGAHEAAYEKQLSKTSIQ